MVIRIGNLRSLPQMNVKYKQIKISDQSSRHPRVQDLAGFPVSLDQDARSAVAAGVEDIFNNLLLLENVDFGVLYSVSVTSKYSLTIPGVLDDCGNPDSVYTTRVICSKDASHASYIKSGNSCGQPGCPRHWSVWARQAADRIGFRVDGFQQASRSRYPPRKIILSIEDDDPVIKTWRARKGDHGAVKAAREYFIKKATEIGCKGGSLVIHLWRTNDNVPGYIQGQKKWDWVRSQGKNWKKYVKFSPHAHIIGYGYLKRPDEDKFEYKNMGPLRTREEIEAVSFYNLSHAPVGKGITAVVYFGCCSYGKLKTVWKSTYHYDCICPDCGAVMIDEISREPVQRVRTWGEFKVVQAGEPG